jgi:TDG/mug DNA glycosylase family protein
VHEASGLIGYQTRVDWMGTPTLTLEDLWPESPRAMIVGLNPAPPSVDAGHYYPRGYGRMQLIRLAKAGLFELPSENRFFEEEALAAGVGFTDLVKRPACKSDPVRPQEGRYGRETALSALKAQKVPLIICVFRAPVKPLLGQEEPPGLQSTRTSWGGLVFRMAGPTENREKTARVMDEFEQLLRQL